MPADPKVTKNGLDFEPLVDASVIAKMLGVTVKFLEQDRATGRYGIPYFCIGGRRRYRPSAVIAWAEEQAVRPGKSQA